MKSIEEFLEWFADEAMMMPDSTGIGPIKEKIEALGGPRGFANGLASSATGLITGFTTILGIPGRNEVAQFERRCEDLEERFDLLAEYLDTREISGAATEAPAGLPASQPLDRLLVAHFINMVRALIMDGFDEEQARAFFLADAPARDAGWGAREARRYLLEGRRLYGRAAMVAAERMIAVPVVFSVVYAAAEREHQREPASRTRARHRG